MKRTVFNVPKMDCPSEERLIRMALDKVDGIKRLDFDLAARKLIVLHTSLSENVLAALEPLNFGAKILESSDATLDQTIVDLNTNASSGKEQRVLKQVLAINAAMFVAELTLGWIAQSAGLIADSLDMFADAAVYGLSLYAVGRAANLKNRAARISGYLQLCLAFGTFAEVLRRAVSGSEPQASFMMSVALAALLANTACLYLLSKHREGGAHMKASWIFTTNDVLANLGVILAGFLVRYTASSVPDLIIGTLITILVFTGAIRILKVAK